MTKDHLKEQIKIWVEESAHILLIAHQKPDGDTIGSVLSMAGWFNQLNKQYKIFCKHEAPENFKFLEGSELIQTDTELFSIKRFDLIIVCDSSDFYYAGVSDYIESLGDHRPRVINIDHHGSNLMYGDINLVNADASSNTQVIFDFFKHEKINITAEMATCLLTGIITDTSSFTNPATTVESLTAASELLLLGASLATINQQTYQNKDVNILKFWGLILERLQYSEDYKMASTVICLDDSKNCGVNADAADGIANFLNNLDGVRSVLLLREVEGDKIKVSLRTTDADADMTPLALWYGGGGHPKAAGFSIDGHLKIEHGKIIVE